MYQPDKVSFATIEQDFENITIKLTQQAWVLSDRRKHFGPIKVVVLLNKEHCMDSWTIHIGRKMTNKNLIEQHLEFLNKNKHLITAMKVSNRFDIAKKAEQAAIDEILKSRKVD